MLKRYRKPRKNVSESQTEIEHSDLRWDVLTIELHYQDSDGREKATACTGSTYVLQIQSLLNYQAAGQFNTVYEYYKISSSL